MNEKVAYLTFRHNFDERQNLVWAFTKEKDEATGDFKTTLKVRPQFLVRTTKLLCTGYTCVSCQEVLIFELDYLLIDINQVKGQVSRIGQKVRETKLYTFLTENSRLEYQINNKGILCGELMDLCLQAKNRALKPSGSAHQSTSDWVCYKEV